MIYICLEPRMKDLLGIVVLRISSEWSDVAHHLNFEIAEIKIIREKWKEDPEKCCKELLERWLQVETAKKTWETLLTAFKKIRKLTAVTEQIETDLTNPELYVNVIFEADLFMYLF